MTVPREQLIFDVWDHYRGTFAPGYNTLRLPVPVRIDLSPMNPATEPPKPEYFEYRQTTLTDTWTREKITAILCGEWIVEPKHLRGTTVL